MKKIHFKTVLLILLCFYLPAIGQGEHEGSGSSDGPDHPGDEDICISKNQQAPVQESIGLNYQFYHDPSISKLEGIAGKFRRFTAWHNTGGQESACSGSTSLPFEHNFNNYHPDVTSSTFPRIDDVIEELKFDINNPEDGHIIDAVFPAMTSSIRYLALDRLYGDEPNDSENTIEWYLSASNDRISNWRKPVPFIFDTNNPDPNAIINSESFTDPNSYRHFAEMLSHYVGYFGEGASVIHPNNYSSWLYSDGCESWESIGFQGNHPRGSNTHIELWNEPDAWWGAPNDYQYFTPKELAAMCHAALGGQTTQINNYLNGSCDICESSPEEGVQVGILDYCGGECMTVISPSPHEMDIVYFQEFMNELQDLRPGYTFDVNGFHHYSAYTISDLGGLESINPSTITKASTTRGFENVDASTHDYHLGTLNNEGIKTVALEATPNSSNAYWICPELDGYIERGAAIVPEFGDSWVTEWGYSSINGGEVMNVNTASYPESLSLGANAEEIQARWLMRGFLEYDASLFSASFWHWYQEETGPDWDTNTGILDANGGRKIAWYYLHTLISEIGDKGKFSGDHELHESYECIGWEIPSATISGSRLMGMVPTTFCPKIYEYGDASDLNDVVYAIWFPSMTNFQHELAIFLDDFSFCGDAEGYYTVIPTDGAPNGLLTPIMGISEDASTGKDYITVPVTEKPIFIHFVGEHTDGNDDPNNDPGVCEWGFNISCSESTCTSTTLKVGLQSCNTLSGEILPETVIVTAINENEQLVTSTIAAIQPFGSGNNTGVDITISGLLPDHSYTFSIGSEFSTLDGNDFGYHWEEYSCRTSAESDCLEDITIDTSDEGIELTYECTSAELCVSINTPNYTEEELSILSVNTSMVQTGVLNGSAISPNESLLNIPFSDWRANGNDWTVCVDLPNLSPGASYTVVLILEDYEGNQYSSGNSMTYSFTVPEEDPSNGTTGDDNEGLTCAEGLGGVEGIDVVTSNCEINICFTPIGNNSEYKLFLKDENGDIVEFFVDFSTPLNNEGKHCFNIDVTEDMSTIPGVYPTFIGQILTISPNPSVTGNTFSDKFEVSNVSCCRIEPIGDLYNSCDELPVFVANFQVPACSFDWEVSASTKVDFETMRCDGLDENGYSECIFFARFNDDCPEITFDIVFNLENGESITISETIDRTSCCGEIGDEDSPTTHDPVEFEYAKISETGKEVSIYGKLPNELDSFVENSRKNNVPMYYALMNSKSKIIDIRPYTAEIQIVLPEKRIDASVFNANYNLQLWVDNEIISLVFPELERTEGEGGGRLKLNEGNSTVINTRVNVFPNPSQGELTVSIDKGIIESIQVYDLSAKLQYEKIHNSNNINMNVPSLGAGIYFLEVNTDQGERIREKIIIQKK